MTEYFRPSKIWAGKLCYVRVTINGRDDETVFLPCRILGVFAGQTRIEVSFDAVGNGHIHYAAIKDVFDRIDGPTIFHDIPGGKP